MFRVTYDLQMFCWWSCELRFVMVYDGPTSFTSLVAPNNRKNCKKIPVEPHNILAGETSLGSLNGLLHTTSLPRLALHHCFIHWRIRRSNCLEKWDFGPIHARQLPSPLGMTVVSCSFCLAGNFCLSLQVTCQMITDYSMIASQTAWYH